MNKAFIFDMDGVMIDTERAWKPYEEIMFEDLVGAAIAARLPSVMGLDISGIYEEVKKLGHTGSRKKFIEAYNKYAKKVYKEARLTGGTERLINVLQDNDFEIGIVSSSPQNWIEMFLDRISFKSDFKHVISLDNHPKLRAKPYPDGYIHMIKFFGVAPEKTIILEDSNYGIEAGKKSGAFVIGLKENLHEGYDQKGADVYAENMEDVISQVNKLIKRWEA